MSDNAQQTVMQELERLLPHIRRLEVENKTTADEKAAATEEAIGEQFAKVLARDAALQRETEQQKAARERVAVVEAAPIIEAIRAEAPAPQGAPAIESVEKRGYLLLDKLAALPDLKRATLAAAGFREPNVVLLVAARILGSKTRDPRYARVVVANRIAARRAESLAAADLSAALPEPVVAKRLAARRAESLAAAALPEPDIASPGESPTPSEGSRTPTAPRTRAEGSGGPGAVPPPSTPSASWSVSTVRSWPGTVRLRLRPSAWARKRSRRS